MADNTRDKYVVGIGEVLWDMLPDGRKVGGATANFASGAMPVLPPALTDKIK